MVDDLILTGSEIVVYMLIHYLVCLLGVGGVGYVIAFTFI